MAKAKVLFTTPMIEHPASGGPYLRIENSIKALSLVSDLYIVSRRAQGFIGGQKAESFYKGFCREFTYAPCARLSANRYIRIIQRQWYRWIFRLADARFILRLVDKYKADVVWCGYGNMSFELINRLKIMRPELKIVCDTDSVWSRFILREFPFESDPKRKRKIKKEGVRAQFWERKMADICDITTAVSDVDAQYYRGIAARPERIAVFSNSIDLKSYENIFSRIPDFKKPCIYLAGTFGHRHSPMDRAARWMINEVFPRVKKEIPEIHFYIVGAGSDVIWGALNDPAITVTGKLFSVLPYLFHADVAVVPLQFESGTRFKILEAGACGVAVVSTTLGAEGIPVTHGKEALLADTPQEFAESIIRLIKDRSLAAQLGVNCRQLVREKYSIESLSREAQSILCRLVKY